MLDDILILYVAFIWLSIVCRIVVAPFSEMLYVRYIKKNCDDTYNQIGRRNPYFTPVFGNSDFFKFLRTKEYLNSDNLYIKRGGMIVNKITSISNTSFYTAIISLFIYSFFVDG